MAQRMAKNVSCYFQDDSAEQDLAQLSIRVDCILAEAKKNSRSQCQNIESSTTSLAYEQETSVVPIGYCNTTISRINHTPNYLLGKTLPKSFCESRDLELICSADCLPDKPLPESLQKLSSTRRSLSSKSAKLSKKDLREDIAGPTAEIIETALWPPTICLHDTSHSRGRPIPPRDLDRIQSIDSLEIHKSEPRQPTKQVESTTKADKMQEMLSIDDAENEKKLKKHKNKHQNNESEVKLDEIRAPGSTAQTIKYNEKQTEPKKFSHTETQTDIYEMPVIQTIEDYVAKRDMKKIGDYIDDPKDDAFPVRVRPKNERSELLRLMGKTSGLVLMGVCSTVLALMHIRIEYIAMAVDYARSLF